VQGDPMTDDRLDELARRFAAAREAHERTGDELDRVREELLAELEASGEPLLESAGYRFRVTPGSTYLRTSRKLLEDALEASSLSPTQREDLLCAALVETEKRATLTARRLAEPDEIGEPGEPGAPEPSDPGPATGP